MTKPTAIAVAQQFFMIDQRENNKLSLSVDTAINEEDWESGRGGDVSGAGNESCGECGSAATETDNGRRRVLEIGKNSLYDVLRNTSFTMCPSEFSACDCGLIFDQSALSRTR